MLYAAALCWLLMQAAYCAEPVPDDIVMVEEPASDAVMLTRPDGSPIWVNPHAIAFIRPPMEGEHGNTTIVFANGAKQQVRESVDEIKKIVQGKEGP